MLIPAAVAIFLQRYIFADSPIYYRNFDQKSRWFYHFYLVFTLTFVVLVGLVTVRPDFYPVPLASAVILILVIAMILLLVIRLLSGKEAFQQAGLAGGKWIHWVWVWLAVMVYHSLQLILNLALELGYKPEITSFAAEAAMDVPTFLVAGFVNTAIIGPLLGLLIAFGEEYGWRGYLQGELIKLGRVKGVLLVGLIWGIWHAPAVAMGHNYPGYPILGPIAFLIFNLFLAIFWVM